MGFQLQLYFRKKTFNAFCSSCLYINLGYDYTEGLFLETQYIHYSKHRL